MSAYVNVGNVGDFPEGKIRRRFIGSHEIGVVFWRGRFFAFDNLCPHAGFQMNFAQLDEGRILCPLHFALFELATGKALEGPYLVEDLGVYEVRIEGEAVLVGETALPAVDTAST